MTLRAQWKLLSKLNPGEKDVIEGSRRRSNSVSLKLTAALTGPLFLFFWLGVFFSFFVNRSEPLRPYYLVFFGTGAAFSLLFLLFRKLAPLFPIFGAYASLTLASVLCLNLVGMYKTGDRSIYILALMACALLFSTPLRWYAITFPAVWLASVLGMVVFFPPEKILNNAAVLFADTALALSTAIVVELRRSATEILAYRLGQKNDELREISLRDPLTGIYNRRFLQEWLHQAVAGASRGSSSRTLIVALIDLDHLKKINDEAGHTAGDAALKLTATILKASLRKADVLSRYGGDEFIAAMPATSIQKARSGIERCSAILKTRSIPNWDQPLTFSCGLAAWEPGMDEYSLISEADKRMYGAKGSGRDRIVS